MKQTHSQQSLNHHVTLKIYTTSTSMGRYLDSELDMYRRVEGGPKRHPGRDAVRSLLDTFDIDSPDGSDRHRYLVHAPLFESVWTFLHRNPIRRVPAPVLAFVLKRVFLALEYLAACRVIHTGEFEPWLGLEVETVKGSSAMDLSRPMSTKEKMYG